jgi:uncharacterized protein YqjF (DUF2071 family)
VRVKQKMGSLIPKHPLPMRTCFRTCFLVNFSVNADVMQRLLPAPLVPDVYEGEAFLSIVIADMDRMRPAFLPGILGVTYNQVVYRVVVQCQGRRGVHFIRSDADNGFMCLMGNLLTFFNFHRAHMTWKPEGHYLHFDLFTRADHRADIHATFDLGHASQMMPDSSIFDNLEEAKHFLVELYDAFAPDPSTHRVSRVHIDREDWDISVINDVRMHYQFMQSGPTFSTAQARLDSVFYVKNLPYFWHKLEWIC